MKEYIMSFFNAPITNKVPAGVCSVAGLHTFITSNEYLKEMTLKVRSETEDEKLFRKKSRHYCLTSHRRASFRTARNNAL